MAKPARSDVPPEPVRWIGSSREDLRNFPDDVRRRVGGALWDAQIGLKALYAKPLKGFGGATVLEIVDDFDGNTYRAIYTVRFTGAVYYAACLSEEVQTRHRHSQGGDKPD